jgi:hypothetical protein
MLRSRLAATVLVFLSCACSSSNTKRNPAVPGDSGAIAVPDDGSTESGAVTAPDGAPPADMDATGGVPVGRVGDESGLPPGAGPTGDGTTVVDRAIRVNYIAVYGQFVYYITELDLAIYKAPIDGSAQPSIMFSSTARAPTSIAVDATGIYWTESGNNSTTDSAIRSCPLAGCPAIPATLASMQTGAERIAIDAASVYWLTGNYTVVSVKRDGSGGKTVFTAAVGASPTFYRFGSMAADGATLFFTSIGIPPNKPGGTWACSSAGCGEVPTRIGDGAWSLAIDATHVFTAGGGSMRQALKDGTSPVALDATLDGADVATDGVNVYWTSGAGVYKCKVDGCAGATRIATIAGGSARAIALDASFVYWADYGMPYPPVAGAIRRAPK